MADGEVIFNIVGDTSEYDKSIKKAEDTANSSQGKIKAGAVAAWAAVGTAVVAAGKLITDTIKQSVSLYSEYEQLAGGVETLFKESSGVVMDYAANAYKTAGLSANEYMSTVTSFSASLLQSLGGDTEEAARMADVAITDMSDNANKMGTDMAAIQNAYQGFAKQNYTMLDNLKLGYGGTKEEMQRLIDDANKLREAQGLNADLTIDSYADVVEAIHTVQKEMGIAGATADEAATTIQGSANMAKAAWQNLLTGLGDADANIGELVDNVVASFNTLLANLIPVIENIISALPAVIEGLASALLEMAPTILSSVGEIITLLIDLIIESLPMLIDAGLQMIMALMEGLVQNAGDLADAAVEIVTSLSTFVVDNIDKIIDAAITLFMSFLTAILDPGNIQKLVDAAVKLVVAIVTGLIKALPQLLQAAVQLVTTVLQALLAYVGEYLRLGAEWISNLTQGVRNKISDVVQAGHDLAEQVKAKLREKIESFKQIGRDLLEGLKNGIKEKVSSIISSVTGAVSDAISAAKRLLGIASPSKVFRAMGHNVDEGLALGIDDGKEKPVKAIKKVVDKVTDIAEEMTDDMRDALNRTSKNMQYAAEKDYSAMMLEAKSLEEFLELAAQRNAKIMGENIDLVEQSYRDNAQLLSDWADATGQTVEELEKQLAASMTDLKGAVEEEVDQMVAAFGDMAGAFADLLNTIGISGDVAVEYDPEVDYSALMDEAKDTEEFLSLAAKRNAKIMGENINLVEKGWRDNASIMNTWLTKTTQDIGQIRQVLTDALEDVSKYTSDSANKIVDTASGKMVELKDNTDQMKKGMEDSLSTMPSDFQTIGANTIDGLIKGLQSRSSALYETMRSIAQQTVNTMKAELEISSPSKVFARLGGYVDEGFARGITADANKAINAVMAMISGAMNGLSAAYAGTGSSSYSTSNVFSIPKLSDSLTVRSDADIDAIAEALYQRFMTIMRGRGQF